MTEGIRVTVSFDDPEICPIVDLSRRARIAYGSVATNVCGPDCTRSVTEFSMPHTDVSDVDVDVDEIFAHGGTNRYRFRHDDVGCPCQCLGSLGCPVDQYRPQDGRLELEFYAASYDQLQTVMTELQDRFPGMDVKRFVRSTGDRRERDEVIVDRSELTDRQREILALALERGYFDQPREVNATALADELDVSPSTLREHITAAERKIFRALL